jgi:hypothetical protein
MITLQEKKVIIDGLIKVVNSSPTRQLIAGKAIDPGKKLEISQQELSIWANYVNSVLDVFYDLSPLSAILNTKIETMSIANQVNIDCINRAFQIENKLLNLAKIIADYK